MAAGITGKKSYLESTGPDGKFSRDNTFLGQRVKDAKVTRAVLLEGAFFTFKIVSAPAEGISVESILLAPTQWGLSLTTRAGCKTEGNKSKLDDVCVV